MHTRPPELRHNNIRGICTAAQFLGDEADEVEGPHKILKQKAALFTSTAEATVIAAQELGILLIIFLWLWFTWEYIDLKVQFTFWYLLHGVW